MRDLAASTGWVLITITMFSLGVRRQEQKAEAKPEIQVDAPKVLPVEFYADSCSACKELMP